MSDETTTLEPAAALALQTYLNQIFAQYGLEVAVGLTKHGVAIRSQDPRVDAANIGTVRAQANARVSRRLGNEISDEERRAYMLGWRDCLEALRSDEVYYEVCGGKPGLWENIEAAALFIEGSAS